MLENSMDHIFGILKKRLVVEDVNDEFSDRTERPDNSDGN